MDVYQSPLKRKAQELPKISKLNSIVKEAPVKYMKIPNERLIKNPTHYDSYIRDQPNVDLTNNDGQVTFFPLDAVTTTDFDVFKSEMLHRSVDILDTFQKRIARNYQVAELVRNGWNITPNEKFKIVANINKELSDEYRDIWRLLSSMIMAKKAINFPVIYKETVYKNHLKEIIYEFYNSARDISQILMPADKAYKGYLVQLAAIMETLRKRNIVSDDYRWGWINIDPTKITYAFGSVAIKIDISTILILTPKTKLRYSASGADPEFHFNKFCEFTGTNTRECSSILEWIITNCSDLIQSNMVPGTRSMLTQPLSKYHKPGARVYIKSSDPKHDLVGMLLHNDVYSDMCMISIINGRKQNSLHMPRDNVYADDFGSTIINGFYIDVL